MSATLAARTAITSQLIGMSGRVLTLASYPMVLSGPEVTLALNSQFL